ncbi:HAD-IA family hydrolase [Clostridium sp. 'White wine YQ']|uniref:HAD-IA family hydrolase n=1 Tax=Clostridium sp. 'White wine YQ' TaxID=3027474 RepID=UPI002366CE21|nr:HAD-IA family hydrolase [Clostridium sp. 'White wine YQ']MDD7793561.1 HAD-IA family hydrolase [Clostridium sp. 'White wine YQ']
MNNNIKAILLDSGRVLNSPITGSWSISPNFYKYINKKKFNSPFLKNKNNAMEKAWTYINSQKLVVTEEEEFKLFLKFFEILSSELPELELSNEKVQLLAMDFVYNYDKYKFYDDVFKVIPLLSKSYKLAVISDAWPSLENVFRQASLRNYFSSFIISSKIGVTKPNELMFKCALEELGVKPEEALFIDDNPYNCDGASKLGIKTVLLNREKLLLLRNKVIIRSKHKVIRNLYDLLKLLEK